PTVTDNPQRRYALVVPMGSPSSGFCARRRWLTASAPQLHPRRGEFPERVVVVLDRELVDGLREPEGCLAARTADRAVGPQPLLEHVDEHWNRAVDVVADSDFSLPRMMAMQPTAVLDQGSLP